MDRHIDFLLVLLWLCTADLSSNPGWSTVSELALSRASQASLSQYTHSGSLCYRSECFLWESSMIECMTKQKYQFYHQLIKCYPNQYSYCSLTQAQQHLKTTPWQCKSQNSDSYISLFKCGTPVPPENLEETSCLAPFALRTVHLLNKYIDT